MVATKRAPHGDVEYHVLESEYDQHEQQTNRSTFEIKSSADIVHAKSSSENLLRRESYVESVQPRDSCCHRCCLCCRSRCHWLCCTKQGCLTILSVFIALLGALVFLYYACRPVPYISHIDPLTSEPAVFNNTVKVLLVGDSMWGIPQRRTGLCEKIAAFLPQYSLSIIISGKLGVRAEVLRPRMPWNMEHLKPDVAFLLIDSDVTNVNEDVMTPDEKAFSRQNYSANMDWIVSYITKPEFHVLNMALMGPSMLGEGPFLPLNLMEMSVAERFRNKGEMLKAHIQMNKEIARRHNIPHIDMCAAFRAVLPWYRLYFNGYVTRDGEHPNERGTEIQARLVSEMLLSWFQTYNDSIITTPRLPVNGLMTDDKTHRTLANTGDVEGYGTISLSETGGAGTPDDVWNNPDLNFIEFESSNGVVSRYAYLE